jgi:hypothetical protein
VDSIKVYHENHPKKHASQEKNARKTIIDETKCWLGNRPRYGKEILNWVELQAAKMKAVDLFLESGITNEDAHDFFGKNGFEVVSKVMIKKVHYEK